MFRRDVRIFYFVSFVSLFDRKIGGEIMNRAIIFILISAILIFGFTACGDKDGTVKTGEITNLPTTIPTEFAPQEWTPAGVRITTVTPINDPKVYQAIDEGVKGAIRSYQAVFPEWQITPAEFDVMCINPQVLNQDGSPAILVHNIQSAGTVIGVDRQPFSPTMIVVAHQRDMDWRYIKYLKFSIWNESEHYLEWRFSPGLFYAYATAADIHPHTPRVYADGEEQE